MNPLQEAKSLREGDMDLWPKHKKDHRRTPVGYRLFDTGCVRCWIASEERDLTGTIREDLPNGI